MGRPTDGPLSRLGGLRRLLNAPTGGSTVPDRRGPNPSVAFLKLYLSSLAVFLAVDLVWLGLVARDFYQARLGLLLAPEVRWGAALLFYLIFVLGILVLATLPALASEAAVRAALLGGLLGLVAYAVFDLTCLALFRDFPVTVVVVDMAWGATLSAVTATAGYGLARGLGWG